MGWFSDKVTWVAYVGSSDLMPPEDRSSTWMSLLFQNILSYPNDAEMVDVFTLALWTDFYARARSMARYAGKEDGYVRGYPESNMATSSIPLNVIEPAMDRAGVTYDSIYSTRVSSGQSAQFGKVWLKENYLSLDWTLGAPPQWDEQLATIPIPVINPNTGTYYEVPNNVRVDPVLRDGIDPDDLYGDDAPSIPPTVYFDNTYLLYFEYTDVNGDPQEYQVPDPIDFGQWYEPYQQIIFVRYLYNGEMLYWWYTQGSGIDPTLEDAFNSQSRNGNFLPVIILMEDKRWVDEDTNSQLYITTNKMLKKLSTSVDEVKEQYLEQEAEDDSTQDLKKANAQKWDFFIHFAVPVRTKARGGLEYLYFFFQQLQDWADYTEDDYFNWLDGNTTTEQPHNVMEIEEGGVTGYSAQYLWSFIKETDPIPGYFPKEIKYQEKVVDPVTGDISYITQTGTRDMRPNEATSLIMRREAGNEVEYREGLELVFGEGNVPAIPPYIDPKADEAEGKNSDYVIITRQLRRTTEEGPAYSHILMFGLESQYKVNTSDKEKNAYRVREANCKLFDDEAEPDVEGNSFRFPVHWDSLQKVPRMHREEVIQAAFTGTVTIRQKQVEKWYASGFWKWLIIIVAVVLIVLSFVYAGGAGSEEAVGLIGTIVSATGATGFAAFVLYVVLSFAMGFIITLAGSLIGGTAGRIFTVIGTIAMAYGTFANPNFSWTGSATSGFGQAMTFIANVNSIIAQPVLAIVAGYQGEQIEAAQEELALSEKERIQELRDAYDGIGDNPSNINVDDLIEVFMIPRPDEKPDDFLGRTLDANPGRNAIDLVLYFTDVAKELPEHGSTGFLESMFVDLAKQRGRVYV